MTEAMPEKAPDSDAGRTYVDAELIADTRDSEQKLGFRNVAPAERRMLFQAGETYVELLIPPEGSMNFVQRMIQAILPPEQQTQIPPFPSSPPLGFSFQYDGQALEAGLVAPAEFLTALGKYIQAIQQAAVR